MNPFKNFRWRVVFAIAALAIALGIANNFRVYEERRVALFGVELP